MAFLSSLFLAFHRERARAFSAFPGPSPSFPLGNTGDFLWGAKPWEVLARYAAEHGGVAVFWLLAGPALAVSDPELIRTILVDGADDYHKDDPFEALLPVLTADTSFLAPDRPRWEPLARHGLLASAAGPAWAASQVEARRVRARSPAVHR